MDVKRVLRTTRHRLVRAIVAAHRDRNRVVFLLAHWRRSLRAILEVERIRQNRYENLIPFVVAWHALTAAVEEAMKRDEGPYRNEIARAADRPHRGAGCCWSIDGRVTE